MLGGFLAELQQSRTDQRAAGVEVAAHCDAPGIEGHQPGSEGARLRGFAGVQDGLDVGIGRGSERHAFPLAIHDQPSGDRLHASGGQLRHDLLPQHRGDLVAVEPVQNASGLLGIDQVVVEFAGVLHRGQDRFGGDLVEDHPLHRDLGFEFIEQMPGDCLPFAVFIRCEVKLVGILQLGFEFPNGALLVCCDHIERLEIGVDIDPGASPFLTLVLGGNLRGAGREVANVTTAGLNDVVRTEKLGQADRLCG